MLPQEFYQLPVDKAFLLITCLHAFVLEQDMLQVFIFCHQTFKYPKENRQKQTKSMKLSKTVLPDTEDKERFGVEAGVHEHQR